MNREDVIGRRVEEVFEIYAESDVYSYHLVKLDLGGFLFDDQAKLTPWENSFVGFSPTIATSAFAAPPKPNPLRESYIGPKIAGILVATVVQTPIETLRKDRIYIVFDNGYYLSSGVHLGSTALECDRFDLWYPENKYFEMLREDMPELPAIGKMKQLAGQFTKGLVGGSQFRQTLYHSHSVAEILDNIGIYFQTLTAGQIYGDGAIESDADLEINSCEIESCETASA